MTNVLPVLRDVASSLVLLLGTQTRAPSRCAAAR